MLGVVNVLMTMLNKVTDGDIEKYHMFDTIPAYIMVSFRTVGLLIFIGGIVKSLLELSSQEQQVRSYFIHLCVLGVVYLTFVPVMMVVISWLPAGYRK